jgi:predicted secreted protein
LLVRFWTRRENLGTGLTALLASLFRPSTFVMADDSAVKDAILQFTRGVIPADASLTVEFPYAFTSRALVPIKISVDRVITTDMYVTDVLVLASGNPRPIVLTMHFSALSGAATAETRIRLARPPSGKQTVTAVARMKDGTCFMGSNSIEIPVADDCM